MTDERPGHPAAADVYRGFINAVNRKDLDAAERFVDPERYRENCVGFTHGFVRWDAAKDSIRQVWKGIPDLHVELPQVLADESVVLAHGTVTGTATGRLYGAPATKRGYEASFFDFVRVDDGRIIERVQQADVLGQMRQLYGRGLGTIGLAALFWRLLLPLQTSPLTGMAGPAAARHGSKVLSQVLSIAVKNAPARAGSGVRLAPPAFSATRTSMPARSRARPVVRPTMPPPAMIARVTVYTARARTGARPWSPDLP